MRYFIVLLIFLCSCSSIRKTTDTHQAEIQHTDNSTIASGYAKETTITETGSSQVDIPGDSLSATDYVPVGDTGTMISESDGMTIVTTSIPKKDSTGKTVGNTISTKAKTKAKTLSAPVDKETHIKETGYSNEHKDIQIASKQENKNTIKSVWRSSVGVQIVIGLTVIGVLLFGIYKFIKR